MRSGLAVGLMLVIVSAVGSLHAQPSDAGALVKHGLVLRRERHDAEALDEFRRAYALDPAPRTLAQIALAEQALGKWADAEADLQKALGAGDDSWIASNRRVLDAGLATIHGHLGGLDVEADVKGAELWVNGARVGSLPLAAPMRVEAGSVVVEVRAEGYATARRITSVEPGGSARESLHLVPLGVPALPEMPPASTRQAEHPLPSLPQAEPPRVIPIDRRMRFVSFVLMGAGAVGIAAGSYFGVQTLNTKSQRDAYGNCQGQTCPSTGFNLDQQARSYALQSTAWFTGGLLAAGVGVGLFLMSGSRVLPGGSTALRITVDVGPDRASAGLGGSW
jgi:hypothetical protein